MSEFATSVYCSAEDKIHPAMHDLAYNTGAAIARRGGTTISGGGRKGMMGQLARGARDAGGRTIGVIPKFMVEREWADTDCDELIIVDSMAERKTIMHERCTGHLALPGGLGTMDELLDPWTTGSLELHDKPVVMLDLQSHWLHFLLYACCLAGSGFVSLEGLDRLQVTDHIEEALDACIGAVVLPPWSRKLAMTIPHEQMQNALNALNMS